MLYIFETSSFIHVNRVYPLDLFLPLWKRLTDLGNEGVIRSHRVVKNELRDGAETDPMYVWAGDNKHVFVEQDPEGCQQRILHEILKKFPDAAEAQKQKEHADPWCIALARAIGDTGQACCLVNEEAQRGKGSYHIPNICREFEVKPIKIVQFLRENGIKWT